MVLTPSPTAAGFGIYIHWPFCLAKCPYCDFNSHVADNINQDNWCNSFIKEIEYHSEKIEKKQVVTSIFFGGGTPSLMPPETVSAIIEAIKKYWVVATDVEITLEANPTSVETNKFNSFAKAGINRVSIGIQSLRDDSLKFLGREHSAIEAINALNIARDYFNRTSFDLIYARPNQTINDWEEELEQALELAQGHLSLYQLTIEKGTQFYTLHQRGELKTPSDEESGLLYETTQKIMENAGYSAYEVSNYAQKGHKSQHNLVYWRYGDYIGIGPGAHGRIAINGNKYATRAHKAPNIWQERISMHGTGNHDDILLTPEERVMEMVLMGLRLFEPLLFTELKQENSNFKAMMNWQAIENLKENGLLAKRQDALQTTIYGRQRLESILPVIFI